MAADYDPDNVFAKILRGEIPSEKLYEDEHCYAFMDAMPMGPGHCLVIPKAPSRNLLDIGPEDLSHLMATVQKVARAAKAGFGADGVLIQSYNEPASGQTVFHTHVHIVPRFEGVELKRHSDAMADPETLREGGEKIRAALG
ncbi:HIT family protein [Pararhizobium mangrovi]|uniref:HIT family protein n=1 Tax=Pararhizobium mangrovi TaxID=2590452 RepID=A0A506UEB8_9HYPH|nr:HIT family protein [Pararhizobium mangrovi]TPW31205.1 HIT family protein [Pararhizobium mangrovi]